MTSVTNTPLSTMSNMLREFLPGAAQGSLDQENDRVQKTRYMSSSTISWLRNSKQEQGP